MRHHPDSDVGCYFCNDIVSPGDSTSHRPMDQQCTVSRPGVATIAGALCVELAINTLHHPLRQACGADKGLPISSIPEHPMGIVPHQIRGYISHFSEIVVSAKRFPKCVACSDAVINMVKTNGFEFIKRACAEPKYLEELNGLNMKLSEDAEAMMIAGDNEDDDF